MLFRRAFIEAIKEVVGWIRGLCGAGYLVVVFGSRARGEARIYSDWDLLVVGEGPPPDPPNDLVHLVFLRPGEVEEEIEKFNTLIIDALLEGKQICGPRKPFEQWRETALRRTTGYVKTREGWFRSL